MIPPTTRTPVGIFDDEGGESGGTVDLQVFLSHERLERRERARESLMRVGIMKE